MLCRLKNVQCVFWIKKKQNPYEKHLTKFFLYLFFKKKSMILNLKLFIVCFLYYFYEMNFLFKFCENCNRAFVVQMLVLSQGVDNPPWASLPPPP